MLRVSRAVRSLRFVSGGRSGLCTANVGSNTFVNSRRYAERDMRWSMSVIVDGTRRFCSLPFSKWEKTADLYLKAEEVPEFMDLMRNASPNPSEPFSRICDVLPAENERLSGPQALVGSIFLEENNKYLNSASYMLRLIRTQTPGTAALINNVDTLLKKEIEDNGVHIDVCHMYKALGEVSVRVGEYRIAVGLCSKALEHFRSVVGEEHIIIATCLNNVGSALHYNGESKKSLDYNYQALAMRKKILGEDSSHVASSNLNIAVILNELGKHGEALKLLESSLTIFQKSSASEETNIALTLNQISNTLLFLENYQEALKYQRQAIGLLTKLNHPELSISVLNEGTILMHLGKLDEAEEKVLHVFEDSKRLYGENHPVTATALAILGDLYHRKGNMKEAERYLEGGLTVASRVMGPEHPRVARILKSLGDVLSEKGDYDRALIILNDAKDLFKKAESNDEMIWCLQRIYSIHEKQENTEKAKEVKFLIDTLRHQ